VFGFGQPDGAKRETVAYLYIQVFVVKQCFCLAGGFLALKDRAVQQCNSATVQCAVKTKQLLAKASQRCAKPYISCSFISKVGECLGLWLLGCAKSYNFEQSDAGCATLLRFGHPDGAKHKADAYLYMQIVFC
jgi:hypothetical protein